MIPSTEVTRAGFAGALVSGGVAAAAREAAKAARMSEERVFLKDFIRFLFLESRCIALVQASGETPAGPGKFSSKSGNLNAGRVRNL